MCPAPERQPAGGPVDDPQRLAQLKRENAELKAGLRRELSALRRQLATAEAALADQETTRARSAALERRLAHSESGRIMVGWGDACSACRPPTATCTGPTTLPATSSKATASGPASPA